MIILITSALKKERKAEVFNEVSTMHFEKRFKSALNLGPSQRTLRKDFFCVGNPHVQSYNMF